MDHISHSHKIKFPTFEEFLKNGGFGAPIPGLLAFGAGVKATFTKKDLDEADKVHAEVMEYMHKQALLAVEEEILKALSGGKQDHTGAVLPSYLAPLLNGRDPFVEEFWSRLATNLAQRDRLWEEHGK